MMSSLTCLCIFIHYEYLERQELARGHKLCREKEKNIIKFFVKTKTRETVLQGRRFIANRFIWVRFYSQREMDISGSDKTQSLLSYIIFERKTNKI